MLTENWIKIASEPSRTFCMHVSAHMSVWSFIPSPLSKKKIYIIDKCIWLKNYNFVVLNQNSNNLSVLAPNAQNCNLYNMSDLLIDKRAFVMKIKNLGLAYNFETQLKCVCCNPHTFLHLIMLYSKYDRMFKDSESSFLIYIHLCCYQFYFLCYKTIFNSGRYR